MKDTTENYHGHRLPPEIGSHAIWLYHRFCLRDRDVEALLAERGLEVSDEAIRPWCNRFGPEYAGKLTKRRGRLGDTGFGDEVFVTIRGNLHTLWRAVDQDGDTLELVVQKRRNKHAAKRLLRKLLKGQCAPPRRMVTDKLKSYSAAQQEVMPSIAHCTEQYANNRCELSHQPTRQRERQMRQFKSAGHAQRFLTVPSAIYFGAGGICCERAIIASIVAGRCPNGSRLSVSDGRELSAIMP